MATGLAVSTLLLTATLAWSQPVAGSLEVHWNEGASDCSATPQEALQVHQYEPQTFILRQSPCADFEANFIYLLIGSDKALLIDTGAVADPKAMPLAKTVLELLPDTGDKKLPLLVAHTHRHLDHRAGDPQFASLPSVEVVPIDLEGVQSFFGFNNWPNGTAHLDLGDRTVDVIPTPGHNKTHIAFYDDRTGILFSGDFLLPGRLLIEDTAAYHESALRVIDFLKTRPLTHILGGHIELNAAGRAYRFGSHYHPSEHRLELARADLAALPIALERLNGFYARYPNYILTNPIHNLVALAILAVAVLIFIVWGVRRLIRRRRRTSPRRRICNAFALMLLTSTTHYAALAQNKAAPQTQIVLLGTGTPLPDPERSGPCTAIVVNGTPYLVDVGTGVVRRAAAARNKGVNALEPTNLKIAFITHLHSDHTLGLADVMLTPWVMGRHEPFEVYGPAGTAAMAKDLLKAYETDIKARTEGPEHSNTTGFRTNVHEIKPGVVYKDANLKVTAFAVSHGQLEAFGYRFETPDRTVVISGDTSPSRSLVDNCRRCDVLIHEVYTQASFDLVSPEWKKYRRAYHTSSKELADIATKASPGLLVLYHRANPGCDQARTEDCRQAGSEEQLLKEMHDAYKGKVVAGHDLDVY